MQRLVNAGYGNCVNADRVVAISGIDTAPIKRMVQNARDKGMAIDMTQGRKTKSVIVMSDGYIVLSALTTETFVSRYNNETRKGEEDV